MKMRGYYKIYCRRLTFPVGIKFNKRTRRYIEENIKGLSEYEILEKVVKWYLDDELEGIIRTNHKPMIKLENFILYESVFKE